MARVLEVLRQSEARREWPTPPVATPRPFRPEAEPSPSADDDAADSVPFIEVGGPRPAAPCSARPPVGGEEKPEPDSPLQVRFQPLPPVFAPPLPARFMPELVAFHQPGHRVSEQYRRVLCDITAQSPAESPQVLLFTSPRPRSGTTTVLLNLAVTYARQGTGPITLVDTHFQRPAVAERLGLAPAPGLQEVLAGQTCLGDAVRETAQPNLFALSAGAALGGETALLGGETMRQLLRELRGRFHWVFVDAPSWTGRPEVVALGAACDAVYLVVPHGQDGAAEGHDMLRLLQRHGAPLRGRIFTQN